MRVVDYQQWWLDDCRARVTVDVETEQYGTIRLRYDYDSGRLVLHEGPSNHSLRELFLDPDDFNLDFSESDRKISGIERVRQLCIELCTSGRQAAAEN